MGLLWITMFSITNTTEQLLHIIKNITVSSAAKCSYSLELYFDKTSIIFALVQWKENGQKRKPRNTNYIRFSIDIFSHKLFMYCIYTLSLKQ